jgi:hypothetical protein
LVSTDGNKVIGVFLGSVAEVTFSSEKIATEVAFWLLPGYRKSRRAVDMLDAYEYWAKHIAKVRFVLTAETPAEDRTPRAYARLGYSHIETNYLKKVL